MMITVRLTHFDAALLANLATYGDIDAGEPDQSLPGDWSNPELDPYFGQLLSALNYGLAVSSPRQLITLVIPYDSWWVAREIAGDYLNRFGDERRRRYWPLALALASGRPTSPVYLWGRAAR